MISAMRLLALVPALLPLVPAFAQEKIDFDKQIAPLLVSRCIECHGPDKDKGDLRLDQKAFALPEADSTIVPGKPDESELVHRVELPAGDDDIMPNKGEPLTGPQQKLLRQWVAEGAEWPENGDKTIAALLDAKAIPKIKFELTPLAAGEQAEIDKTVAALRARGAVVQQVAADTEAIDVNFALLRDKVGDAEARLLLPLSKRLVWLDLSRTALSDEGAVHLAKLTELRRLAVANTKVGDAAFVALAKLPNLQVVNAYGTGLGDAGLLALAKNAAVQKVYAWQSKVTKDGAAAAREANGKLTLDLGDYAEARLAAAQQEIAEREAAKKAEAEKAAAQVQTKDGAPINDVCPVSGKAVDVAFFVDFEGKRIGFCCGKCKAAFEKDPKKYKL